MDVMTTIYFDFETGGVDLSHPNISLAAIAVRDGVEVESVYCLIQFDEAKADPEALAINRYDPARWAAEAIGEALAAKRFEAFLNRHQSLTLTSARTGRPYGVARLAGYNSATFDGPRLEAMFNRYKLFPCWRRPTLDVLQLVLEFADTSALAVPNFKLSTVAKAMDISTVGAHDALADCRMTAAIHAQIVARRP